MTLSLSDTIKQAKEDASVFVRMEKGSTARFHLVSKAKTFGNIFFEAPPYPNAPKTMNVPFGTQIPGYKIRPQWAFEVVNEAGKHKILCVGMSVVDLIDKADKAFRPKGQKDDEGAGYKHLDIILSRLPATPWWTLSNAPTECEDNSTVLDLDAEIMLAKADDLAKLRENTPKSQLADGVKSTASIKQTELISSLMNKLELTVDGLNGIISRKFSKYAVSELTMSEASVLIETLQEMH